MDCRRCPLLALPAGAASRALERREGNEPIADRGNDRPMPCRSRRLPASYTRPRSAVGTLAQPDTPDHEQDADDLKRTQRLIQEQTILATRRSPG